MLVVAGNHIPVVVEPLGTTVGADTVPRGTVAMPDAKVSPVRLPSVPAIVLFPVIEAPPEATVNPVSPPSVPVIVLFPVIEAPPEATVNPVSPPSVPVIVLFPVIDAPLAETVNPASAVKVPAETVTPAEKVCSAEKVCAVPLCAALVLSAVMFGLRYKPNKSAASVDALGTLRLNGAPVVVAGIYASGSGGTVHTPSMSTHPGGTNSSRSRSYV